jgi:hypothetical protein
MRAVTALRGAAIALGLLICLAIPAMVGAAQPIRYDLYESSSEPVDCGSFEATLVRTLTGTVTEYLDNRGETVRVQATAQMRGSLTGNGQELGLSGNLLVVIDLVRETFAYDGVVFLATDPGTGVAIQDTGRFLTGFDDSLLLLAGPHDAITEGAQAFCAALD